MNNFFKHLTTEMRAYGKGMNRAWEYGFITDKKRIRIVEKEEGNKHNKHNIA